MTKIEKVISYKQKVYERLKEDIISGKIPQGQILNERKLSDELGISRTPVREALQMLQNEGWVDVEPYKGIYVKEFTSQDIRDVLNVRRSLEILAVDLAINNLTDADIKKLEVIIEEQSALRENYDPNEFIRIDREFHKSIIEMANNGILSSMINIISDKVRCLGIKALNSHERYMETLEEHMAILKALKERDAVVAKHAMEKHMVQTSKTLISYFEKNI